MPTPLAIDRLRPNGTPCCNFAGLYEAATFFLPFWRQTLERVQRLRLSSFFILIYAAIIAENLGSVKSLSIFLTIH
jgi:hypothetical protein